jgi:Cu+-exporting ATPase
MIAKRQTMRPLSGSVLALAALLGIYFGVLTALSGWDFTMSQFAEFWPYIVALAFGFGTRCPSVAC